MAKKSDTKYKTFERQVAKIFTPVYYPDKDGEFRRIPQSGGWDKRVVSGDIVALRYMKDGELVIDKSFPFSLECKIWKNIKHFYSGLYSDESLIFSWMKQSVEDCAITGQAPLVLFKLFRTDIITMLTSDDYYKLAELFGQFSGKMYELKRKASFDQQLSLEDQAVNRVVFILLADFIQWIDWGFYKIRDARKRILTLVPREKT